MDIARIAQHVAKLPTDVLRILDRRSDTRHVDVEVVVKLAGRRVDERDTATAALDEASAAFVEEVALGVRTARGTADEAGVGTRPHDRFGGVELEATT